MVQRSPSPPASCSRHQPSSPARGWCWATVLLLAAAPATLASKLEFKHHNNTELAAILQQVHNQCPDISRLYTLSEPSVRGVPLYVLEFSDKPGHHEIAEPEMKLVANMHGNEVLGRELLLHLASHLCSAHQAGDKEVQQLVSSTRIHLVPSMNPDGWRIATDNGAKDYLIGRNNANDVDLNRDFPDLNQVVYDGAAENNHLLREANFDHRIQPETESLIKMIMDTPFVLSANMHGGDLVANYPYDESMTGDPTQCTPSPDDMTFRSLASVYAGHHPRMSNPATPGCDGPVNEFAQHGGITNGAAWYSVPGGMQDFNYLASNDFEITLELGCDKYPPASSLKGEWEDNKKSLLEFIWTAHWGVKGVIRDSLTGEGIAGATVHTRNITRVDRYGHMDADIGHDIKSASGGDYWRLLSDGEYEIIVAAEGYEPQAKLVQVDNDHKEAVRMDFDMVPAMADFRDEEEEADTVWMDPSGQAVGQNSFQDWQDPMLEEYKDYFRP